MHTSRALLEWARHSCARHSVPVVLVGCMIMIYQIFVLGEEQLGVSRGETVEAGDAMHKGTIEAEMFVAV